LITIKGTGFGTSKTAARVYLGGVKCNIQTITDTEITCLTIFHPAYHQEWQNCARESNLNKKTDEISVSINDNEAFVPTNLWFKFGLLWSDSEAWNGEISPR
jgi:hypothetical protein